FAIQNVLSDNAGMVCDGAKASCAMKVSSAAGSAVRGFLLAMGHHVVMSQGIVADNVEQTICNVAQMIKEGMAATDTAIIEIMAKGHGAR
ncbi:MAG: L-serine ammonia-lyase, iron-sulfur-dependent, subunit alpha, partial [Aeromonas sp.]